MIVSFLKLHPKLQSGEIVAQDNLGVLLIEFFELYGNHFNYGTVGIAVSQNDSWYFDKSHKGFYYPSAPQKLAIQDPNDPGIPTNTDNDVSRGSYAIRQVRSEFGRAYRTLAAMIGSAYENGGIRQDRGKKDNLMITILGSIITISPKVIEHREFLEAKYEELQSGKQNKSKLEAPEVEKPAEVQKRKRDSPPPVEDDVIYISASSDAEPSSPRKRQKPRQSPTASRSRERRSTRSNRSTTRSETAEGDITEYYNMNPNSTMLRDSDGLDYGERFGGPKFSGFNAPNKKSDRDSTEYRPPKRRTTRKR
jgi:DNA polymerase sigma